MANVLNVHGQISLSGICVGKQYNNYNSVQMAVDLSSVTLTLVVSQNSAPSELKSEGHLLHHVSPPPPPLLNSQFSKRVTKFVPDGE